MNLNQSFLALPETEACLLQASLPRQNNAANRISKNKKSTSIFAFAIFILSLFITPASAQLDMIFGTNNVQKNAGSSNGLNAKYLYSTVSPGIDCIVTVMEVSGGAKLFNFDDNSGTYDGEIFRFQPIITAPNDNNNTSYIRFRFQLITSGTYNNTTGVGTNIVPTEPIWFRAYDVDGNGNNGGVREFVELSNSFTGSWVDAPTNLVSKTAVTTGGKAFVISDASINGDNISEEGKYAFNGFIYAGSASTWDIVGGSVVGSDAPNPTSTFSDADRLNSWSFKHIDAIPGIDFGDAPSSYSGTSPVLPAYHLVPSISSNIKVYLGSVKPDEDYDPSGNVSADVDDKNETIDDEDCLTYTYFPKYSGTGNYTVTVTATNLQGSSADLYGYIDFNGNGVFDANERSNKAIVPSNGFQTVTLTFPAGFTYNATSNSRYARFRISTNGAESGSANGASSDGEVEDYRFNTAINISGTVFMDLDGKMDGAIDGTPIAQPSSTQLYAILVDSNNKVIQSTTVINTTGSTKGTYSFDKAGTNSNFKVIISTTAGTVGSTPPAAALPTNWVNTGEGTSGTGDTNADGSYSLAVATTDVTGLNFGIEERPTAVDKTLTTVGNPGGTNIYNYPTGSFVPTDASSGVISYISIASFPANVTSIIIGSNTYTSATWPSGGVTNIPYNSGVPAISIDPTDGNVTVTITYKATDNAGFASANSGIVSIDFKVVSVTGNVWKDVNGDAINSSESVYLGTGLNAILVDNNGKVVETVAVSSTTGIYTLTKLPIGTANYSVVLSTTAGTVGTIAPTPSVPSLYTITGESNAGVVEKLGDGIIILPSTTVSLSARNFGIQQPPLAVDKTLNAVNNPGGTTKYTLPTGSFVPTDVDGSIATISILEFPSNATSITIGSTTYTSSNWPSVGVTGIAYNSGNPAINIDPIDGNVNVDIIYSANDNAGFASSNTGLVRIPFVAITVSGKVWIDKNGDAVETTGETNYVNSALTATLVDNNGKVVQTVAVNADGTYTLTNLPYNVTGYKVVVSTTTGLTLGATAPTGAVPTGYVATGKNTSGTADKTTDLNITLPAATTTLTNRDFGVERLPETIDRAKTFASAAVGYSLVLDVSLLGSDPEDMPVGFISNGGRFVVTEVMPATDAVITYNGVVLAVGSVITNYNPSLLKIKYAKLLSSTKFKYATIDAAGMQDATPATYTINLATLLPLNGIVLSANLQGAIVKLNWDVTTETNVVRYQLERSYDGSNFTIAAGVAYRASTNSTNAYNYTDVPGVTTGLVYYRVIQFKADGSKIISNQVVVRLNDKSVQQVKVFPTLISDIANISIKVGAAQKVVVNVMDASGKIVMKKEFSISTGSTTYPIDGWAQLSNGLYYINIASTDLKDVVKVFVQH